VINARISVDATRRIGAIHPHIFGHFIEHLRECIYNGLWAEMLQNRKFGGHDSVYYGVLTPWLPVGPGEHVHYSQDNRTYYVPGVAGRGQSQRVRLERADRASHGVAQDGLALVGGRSYQARVILRAEGSVGPVEVALGAADGPAASEVVRQVGPEWETHQFTYTAPRDAEDARFAVTFREPGALWIGAASLMPADHLGGWRRDVLELVRALKPPIVRYPGGNFVSGYRWQDGVGERDRRPVRFDYAWNVFEPNDVGTDEFIEWCRLLQTEPYLCVNTGDGTPEEAAAWVEYCNGPTDSRYGALRAEHGHPEPYDVIYWGVGNETYGNWQIGHVDAETYAHECVAFARAMRAVDPRVKLLAVGAMPDRWPDWNEAVARIAGAEIDYVTLHHYARDERDTPADDAYRMTVSAPERIAELIADSRRAIDANAPAGKRIAISFDEWNVAHPRPHPPAAMAETQSGTRAEPAAGPATAALRSALARQAELMPREARAVAESSPLFRLPPADAAARYDERLWPLFLTALERVSAERGPRRQNYALADGLYAAGFFNVMLRNADHITMANQAQLVNLLGLIETSQTDCYGTPEYLAYQLYVDHVGSDALAVEATGPAFDVPDVGNMPARRGVPYVDAAASYDPAGRLLFLHVVNRHPTEPADVAIEVRGLTPSGSAIAHELDGPDIWARNTFEDHDRVRIVTRPAGPVAERFTHRFPARSATSLEVACI
jgi:alpha-L-arabinofuranosidase